MTALTDLPFQPGGGLLANAVMVAHGRPGFLDGVQNAVLQDRYSLMS